MARVRVIPAAVAVLALVAGLVTAVATAPSAAAQTAPSFTRSELQGHSSFAPTSLQFGPDGKLYVAERYGTIKVYTVTKAGANNYQVSATETIGRVAQIPNHDDDGSPATDSITNGARQVTGLLVTGTAQNPVIYVSSSDPRVAPQGGNTPMDTNSGIISRLTQTSAGSWNNAAKVDIVRGLPRNEENHSPNGLAISADGNTLYLAVGGHTNMGAPSNSFAFQWEYALSAAILKIDLPAINAMPVLPNGCDPTASHCHVYDIPTLDDPSRANSSPGVDQGDPWGGNGEDGGANQAMIVPGGPVQLHATGFRNPYDILIHSDGRMYTIDNGPNGGWGGIPNNEGPGGQCDQTPNNAGESQPDTLHYVRPINGQMYYGGHPNPIRGNPTGVVSAAGWSQSPVPTANPVECDFRATDDKGILTSWSHSTNGIAEYTGSNFGGALQGDILAAGWDAESVFRVEVSFNGDTPTVTNNEPLLNTDGAALDVTTRGDGQSFAGTVWVANLFGNGGLLQVFEPNENITCGGPSNADDDSDGYTNGDESANGTNPCNAASKPPDFDKDFVSNLNDPDDDNDGTPDVTDAFAVDNQNGLNRSVPFVFEWSVPTNGILGLGFTGLMTNGSSPWHAQYDATKMTAIGAAGVLTLDEIGSGDALAGANNQQYAFQVGFDPCGACTPYRVSTTIAQPLRHVTPTTQSMGVFMGTGSQSNYAKAVVAAQGGQLGIRVLVEQSDGVTANQFVAVPGIGTAELVTVSLDVDPGAGTAQAVYKLDGAAEQNAGNPVAVPASWSNGATATAAGIIATSGGAAPFTGTFTSFAVTNGGAPQDLVLVNAGGNTYVDSFARTFSADNHSTGGNTFGGDLQIAGTIDDLLYSSERYGASFSYTLPVSAPGCYAVTFYFAEIYWGTPSSGGTGGVGSRVFDVAVEGATVLDNYDIFADVGALTAVTKTVKASTADSLIDIAFTAVVDNAKVSALEVAPTTGCGGGGQPGTTSSYTPMAPVRLFDTRTPPAPSSPIPANGWIDVQIAGTSIPSNATAVVLNLTSLEASSNGFLTAYPAGTTRPGTASMNFSAGDTVTNLVTVPIGVNGSVSFFANKQVHLIADLQGYFVPSSSSAAGRYTPLTPSRLADTRLGSPVATNGVLTIDVPASPVVPDAGVGAVAIAITTIDASANGFITAYPGGQTRPTAAQALARVGQTRTNLAIVPLGSNGTINLYAFKQTHLIVDIVGYFTSNAAASGTSGLFVPMSPSRSFDTRVAPAPQGVVGPAGTITVGIAGTGAIPSNAIAVAQNVTSTNAVATGYVTVFAGGTTRPIVANLFVTNTSLTRGAGAIAPTGSGGTVAYYSHGGTHLVADTVGYFTG